MLRKLLLKGPAIRVFLVGSNNSEPRSSSLKPTDGSIAGIEIYMRDV